VVLVLTLNNCTETCPDHLQLATACCTEDGEIRTEAYYAIAFSSDPFLWCFIGLLDLVSTWREIISAWSSYHLMFTNNTALSNLLKPLA